MTRPLVNVGPHAAAATLPSRAALHPARKLFHFITGVGWALLRQHLPSAIWNVFSWSTFGLFISVEAARIAFPAGRVNRLVLGAFRPFMRASETHEFSGMPYYAFGIALAGSLFSVTSTTIGILCLASLDPVAAFAGTAFQAYIPWARSKNGKSYAGLFFGAFTGMLICFGTLSQARFTSQTPKSAFAAAVLVGWAGALSEFLVPTPRFVFGPKKFPIGIDDNAIIPLVSAAVCEAILTATTQKAQPISATAMLNRKRRSDINAYNRKAPFHS